MSANGFYDIQYKANAGQVNLDQAQGIVECFVAGIGNKDSVGDVCATGAFTKSLMRRKPRVVWGHNWNDPIGKVLEIYEVPPNDPRLPAKMKTAGIGGLYARVQFNLQSEKGKEAFANVAFFGEEQEWSIGYKTLRAQFDQQSQANILYEVELYEVSPVLHGANQLTGTISVKNAEKGGAAVMPMPSNPMDMLEEDVQRKLQEQLSAQLGGKVKVAGISDNFVTFSREGDEENMYKCRFHHEDGAFMFGQPQRIVMPMPQAPKPQQMPQMPMGMPSKPMQTGTPGVPVIVPAALPSGGAGQMPLVRINYVEDGSAEKPQGKPKLVQEEADLAEALIKITKRHGKFNEDATGVWAGYKAAAENPVAKIGVKCSNCVMYEGKGSCKIIDMKVEDGGKCRFAIIPEGVVSATAIKKQEVVAEKEQEEVKWLTDIEAKFPEEFLNGELRMALKRKREASTDSVKMAPISEFASKSLDANTYFYVPVKPEHAFEMKQAIDPIIDYYRADAYVEDGGIVFTSGVNKDFAEAIDTAVKALGRNLAGRMSRGGRGMSARFNPNAWDGDNDGIVQEGTPFQRPAIPGVNDFFTRGKVNKRKARQAWEQYQREGKPKVQKRTPSQAPRPSSPKPTRGEDLASGAPRPGASRTSKRSLTRHSDRDPKYETQFPDTNQTRKRESHEALIQAWEQGMGMPFTTIERQVGEKGPRFSEDWLRGRELGYNDAKARWMGKGTSKRPQKVNDKQKSSADYAQWYMNVVGQLGMEKRNRSQDNETRGYSNDGMEAGVRTFLMENAPQDLQPEMQNRVNQALKDADLAPRLSGLSSGKRDKVDSQIEIMANEMSKGTDYEGGSPTDIINDLMYEEFGDEDLADMILGGDYEDQFMEALTYGDSRYNPDADMSYERQAFSEYVREEDAKNGSSGLIQAFREMSREYSLDENGRLQKNPEKLEDGSKEHLANMRRILKDYSDNEKLRKLSPQERADLEMSQDNDELSARDRDRGLSSGKLFIGTERELENARRKKAKNLNDSQLGIGDSIEYTWRPGYPEEEDLFVSIDDEASSKSPSEFTGNTVVFGDGRRGVIIGSEKEPYVEQSNRFGEARRLDVIEGEALIAITHDKDGNLLDSPERFVGSMRMTEENGLQNPDYLQSLDDWGRDAQGADVWYIEDNKVSRSAIDDLKKAGGSRSGLSSGRRSGERGLSSRGLQRLQDLPDTPDYGPDPDYDETNEFEWQNIPKDVKNEIIKDFEEFVQKREKASPDNIFRTEIDEDYDIDEAIIIKEDGVSYVASPATPQRERFAQAVDKSGRTELLDSIGAWESLVDELRGEGGITNAEAKVIKNEIEKIKSSVNRPTDTSARELFDALREVEKISNRARDREYRKDVAHYERTGEQKREDSKWRKIAFALDDNKNLRRLKQIRDDLRDNAYRGKVSKDGKYEITPVDEFVENIINGGELDYDVDYDPEIGNYTTVSDPAYIWKDFAKFSDRGTSSSNRSGLSSGRRSGERGIDYRQGDPATVGRDMERLSQRSDDLGANFRHLLRNVPEGDSVVFEYRGKLRQVTPEWSGSGSASMKRSADGAVYFGGIDSETGEFRTFRLDRIEGLIQGADYEGYNSGWDGSGFNDPLPRALSGLSSGRRGRSSSPYTSRGEYDPNRDSYFDQDEPDYEAVNDFEWDEIPADVASEITKDIEEYILNRDKSAPDNVARAIDEDGNLDISDNTTIIEENGIKYVANPVTTQADALEQIFATDRFGYVKAPNREKLIESLTPWRGYVQNALDGGLLKSDEARDIYELLDDIESEIESPSDRPFDRIARAMEDIKELIIPAENRLQSRIPRPVPRDWEYSEEGRAHNQGVRNLNLITYAGPQNQTRKGLAGDDSIDRLMRVWRDQRYSGKVSKDGKYEITPLDEFAKNAINGGELEYETDYDPEVGSYTTVSDPAYIWKDFAKFSDRGTSSSNRSGLSSGKTTDIDINDEKTIVDAIAKAIDGEKPEFDWRNLRANRRLKTDEELGREQLEKLNRAIQVRNEILSQYGIKPSRDGENGLDEIDLDNLDQKTIDALDELDQFIYKALRPFELSDNSLDDARKELTTRQQEREDAETALKQITAEKMLLESDFNDGDVDDDGDLIITPEYFEAKMEELNDEEESLRNDLPRLNNSIETLEEDVRDYEMLSNLYGEAEKLFFSEKDSTPREKRRQGLSSGRRDLTDEDIEARNEYMREGMLDQEERAEYDFRRSFASESPLDRAKIAVAYRKETGRSANPQSTRFRQFAEEMMDAKRREDEGRFDAGRDQARGLSSGSRSSARIERVADSMFDDYRSNRSDLENASPEELADKYGVSELVAIRAQRKAQEYLAEVDRDMLDAYTEPTDEELQAMADDYFRRGLSSGREVLDMSSVPDEVTDWYDLDESQKQKWINEIKEELGDDYQDEYQASQFWEEQSIAAKTKLSESMVKEIEELEDQYGKELAYISPRASMTLWILESIDNPYETIDVDYARARKEIDDLKKSVREVRRENSGLSSGRNRKKG